MLGPSQNQQASTRVNSPDKPSSVRTFLEHRVKHRLELSSAGSRPIGPWTLRSLSSTRVPLWKRHQNSFLPNVHYVPRVTFSILEATHCSVGNSPNSPSKALNWTGLYTYVVKLDGLWNWLINWQVVYKLHPRFQTLCSLDSLRLQVIPSISNCEQRT